MFSFLMYLFTSIGEGIAKARARWWPHVTELRGHRAATYAKRHGCLVVVGNGLLYYPRDPEEAMCVADEIKRGNGDEMKVYVPRRGDR